MKVMLCTTVIVLTLSVLCTAENPTEEQLATLTITSVSGVITSKKKAAAATTPAATKEEDKKQGFFSSLLGKKGESSKSAESGSQAVESIFGENIVYNILQTQGANPRTFLRIEDTAAFRNIPADEILEKIRYTGAKYSVGNGNQDFVFADIKQYVYFFEGTAMAFSDCAKGKLRMKDVVTKVWYAMVEDFLVYPNSRIISKPGSGLQQVDVIVEEKKQSDALPVEGYLGSENASNNIADSDSEIKVDGGAPSNVVTKNASTDAGSNSSGLSKPATFLKTTGTMYGPYTLMEFVPRPSN